MSTTLRAATLAVLGAVALALGPGAPAARAHSPHDVVNVIGLAPDFPDDGTIFAACVFTRHRLFLRSIDGGLTWQALGRPFANETPSAFAFSPTYASDGVVFCGTKEGGVWRSADRGTTWTATLTGQVVSYVVVSPDFDTDGVVIAASVLGLQRSSDGGVTWAPSNTGLVETVLTAAAVGPDGALWTGGKTVHRSIDGGLSWAPGATLAQRMAMLVASPADPTGATLAACFGRGDLGVVLSLDAGMSFAPANTGLTDLDLSRLAFAGDGTLFGTADVTGCFRLDAPSGAWVTSAAGLEVLSNLTTLHFRDVAVSPGYAADSTVALATFEGFYLSTDGGDVWEQRNLYDLRLNRLLEPSPAFGTDGLVFLGNYGGGVGIARLAELSPGATPQPLPGGGGGGGALAPGGPLAKAGQAAGAFHPAPGRVATKAPGGRAPLDPLAPHPPAWRAEGAGMVSTYMAALTVSPDFARDRTLWAGHAYMYRSRDAGATWELLPSPSSFPVWREVNVSPDYAVDRLLMAGGSGGGTWRSDDGGDSWTLVSGGLPFDAIVTHIEFSPDFATDGRIWLSTSDAGLWRSTDGGVSWSLIGLPDVEIRWLEVATADTLFVGTIGDGLYRSLDGGDTLVPANAGLPAGPIVIESVAVSPDFVTDGTAFLVSLYDGVYKSTDGGGNWTPSSAGLSVDAPRVIAVSPAWAADQTVLLTTHAGLWRSTDAGASWQRIPGQARADDTHPSVARAGTWTVDLALLQVAGGQPVVAGRASDCGGDGRCAPATAPPPPHEEEPGEPSPFAPRSFGLGTTSSETAGDTITFSFFGDSVEWHALRDSHSGIAEVSVDGGPPVPVDLYAPSPLYRQRVFTRSFGAPGWHTLTVTLTGSAGPFAHGVAVHDDGFVTTY